MSWKYCKGILAFVAMMILSASVMATTHQVTIQGFAFSPDNLTINVGDSVVWTNQDAASHTATSDDGGATFDSGTISNGMSWGMTFAAADTIPYHCTFHPSMTATINVVSPQPVPGLSLAGFLILSLLIVGSTAYIIWRNKTIKV